MGKRRNNNKGFSLTEVLLAIGTLAIGMIFIAGVFPVGLHFATNTTEQSIAAVIANEAFAKVRLIAGDPACPISAEDVPVDTTRDFSELTKVVRWGGGFNQIQWYVYTYPSTERDFIDLQMSELDLQKQYSWYALCRRVDPLGPDVQVTVFVCRKPFGPDLASPVAVVSDATDPILRPDELLVDKNSTHLFNDGCSIVDDETGRIYRVRERLRDDPATVTFFEERIIRLEDEWEPGSIPQEKVWVVAPINRGDRSPCLGVYQKIVRFPIFQRP
ncbi:MAG: type IV pilus modification PilV family protein [Planctomycetota bacterium]|jgi:type II secretory pathway pseudopilin PulG